MPTASLWTEFQNDIDTEGRGRPFQVLSCTANKKGLGEQTNRRMSCIGGNAPLWHRLMLSVLAGFHIYLLGEIVKRVASMLPLEISLICFFKKKISGRVGPFELNSWWFSGNWIFVGKLYESSSEHRIMKFNRAAAGADCGGSDGWRGVRKLGVMCCCLSPCFLTFQL